MSDSVRAGMNDQDSARNVLQIAIDTGGTFTDCVYWSDGELRVSKIPSTPEDPGRAVLEAVRRIAGQQACDVRHGTTVATNALLERKGARIAFITTAGFEDTIEIGRQNRPRLYDLWWQKAPCLAPRERRFGVAERVTAEGEVLLHASEDELKTLSEAVAAQKPESIAISLLFSFVNPANERAVVSALAGLGVPVSASHELLPEFREYERGSTVLINAYLAPKVRSYLERLDGELTGQNTRLHVMVSSGGILPARVAAQEPVRTILSGPAGGVIGASEVARQAGFRKILTFDMGGTSTDVALVDASTSLETTTESQIMGLPVAVPMLAIHTVGAGGGSLAGFDRGGALTVGPESAGADPGPICYGRGERPTVSDANLLLGRIDPQHFLGGAMRLDEERTRRYLALAKGDLDSVESFAEGIVRLSDAHVEKALRKISVERGFDPREFALVSFGGAGPLHACALARALQIPKVLIPRHPGALSAFGILVSDMVRDYSRTVMLQPLDACIDTEFRRLEQKGRAAMQHEGQLSAVAERSLDMRYAGQGYELSVPWSDDYVREFHRLHERRYGYSDPERPVEIVNVRVRMRAVTRQVRAISQPVCKGDGKQVLLKHTSIYFEGRHWEAAVYDRALLEAGDQLAGPAVIIEYTATSFLPPGARLVVDSFLNLVIDV